MTRWPAPSRRSTTRSTASLHCGRGSWSSIASTPRRWGLFPLQGYPAALRVDDSSPLLELFTGDTLPSDRRRRGLGVEPMTCPPNAFQTGERVIRLEPDATATTRWDARLESGATYQ